MKNIESLLKSLNKTLPHFDDGRINYKGASTAIVISCFVMKRSDILLLKRSNNVGTYKGKWGNVAGYVDEIIPLDQKVKKEIMEETGINSMDIVKIVQGMEFESNDILIGKRWLIIPFLALVSENVKIKLSSEHVKYEWVKPDNIISFDTVPDFTKSLECVMNIKV